MVFIIQQSQNKDTTAIQLKLNELIASNEKASNRLVDIEHLTDEELQVLKKFYIKLSHLADEEKDLFSSIPWTRRKMCIKRKVQAAAAPLKKKPLSAK